MIHSFLYSRSTNYTFTSPYLHTLPMVKSNHLLPYMENIYALSSTEIYIKINKKNLKNKIIFLWDIAMYFVTAYIL